jgi:hypothetical protein
MSLSDGERPRAPSFARCVVTIAMDGLLMGLTVQAAAVCLLREAVLDAADARLRVTLSR